MNKIKCQFYKRHAKGKGCPACGGYGYMAAVLKLKCGCETLTRPGAYTCYDGKQFISFSGMRVICRAINGGIKYFCLDHNPA